MNIPSDRTYSKDHEWAQRDGSLVRIGITDYAQDSLGDIVYVQLPDVGDTVLIGDSFGEVESTKSVSELYAPVGGTVTDVNSALEDDASTINADPYGEGWVCIVDVGESALEPSLMSAEEYKALISDDHDG